MTLLTVNPFDNVGLSALVADSTYYFIFIMLNRF